MLEHSFIHVPGIGPHRERQLWCRGYTDWARFRRDYPAGAWRELVLSRLDRQRAMLDMPRREAWRLLDTWRGRLAFLDIETAEMDGERDAVTVIGLSDGTTVEAFVRGRNLDAFPRALRRFEALVTYNGSCFDLPVLERAFPDAGIRGLGHIDLRYPLNRLGFRGGLKAAERAIGLERPREIRELDGWFAILLWRAHRSGRAGALDTLVRYCLEDVVNLQPLAIHVYNTLVRDLPIDVAPIADCPRPEIPWRADGALVRQLVDRDVY